MYITVTVVDPDLPDQTVTLADPMLSTWVKGMYHPHLTPWDMRFSVDHPNLHAQIVGYAVGADNLPNRDRWRLIRLEAVTAVARIDDPRARAAPKPGDRVIRRQQFSPPVAGVVIAGNAWHQEANGRSDDSVTIRQDDGYTVVVALDRLDELTVEETAA